MIDTYPHFITRAGMALWGKDGWQAEMARALNVSPETVSHWQDGSEKPTISALSDLFWLTHDRITDLRPATDEMEYLHETLYRHIGTPARFTVSDVQIEGDSRDIFLE